MGARHRRVLAKSVPPILDALPRFFPNASLEPRPPPPTSSSSLAPIPLFPLPSRRPPPAWSCHFIFARVRALFLVVLENPPLLFPGLGSGRPRVDRDARTRCNLFLRLRAREKYRGEIIHRCQNGSQAPLATTRCLTATDLRAISRRPSSGTSTRISSVLHN